jgi:psiF repeat
MKAITTLAAAALFGLVSVSGAFAQTPAPAAAAKPAAAAPAGDMGKMDKAAMSKKCSADADAKGLHGKARKEFRSKCKAGKM